MNSNDILDLIGDAGDEYIWDTQQVRSNAAPSVRRPALQRTLLIAAIIALMLLLMGCTVAYVQGWFAEFFTIQSEQTLSNSQLEFLEQNEQKIRTGQTIDGWTLELGSVISDGNRGYILIGITAPEDVSLERVYNGDVVMSHLDVGNSSYDEDYFSLLEFPKGVESGLSYGFREDGDGLANTEDLVIEIYPVLEECTVNPFGKDSIYHISIKDILRLTVNEEIWDGVSDIFTFGNIWLKETLAEGTWEFAFDFGLNGGTVIQQELLTAPFSTAAMHWMQYGEDRFDDDAWFIEEFSITSFVLKPLSAIITFEPRDENATYFSWYQNPICVVLKDGREIKLTNDYGGNPGTFLMQASAPIIPEEVDHIRMADGTVLCPDGTVEPPAWKSEPSTPAPEQLIPGVSKIDEVTAYYGAMSSELGIYGYYTDFDGDEIPDIAIWKDGGYIALCYLAEDSTLREVLTLENALNAAELCTRYGGENAADLEQFEVLKPIGVCCNPDFLPYA